MRGCVRVRNGDADTAGTNTLDQCAFRTIWCFELSGGTERGWARYPRHRLSRPGRLVQPAGTDVKTSGKNIPYSCELSEPPRSRAQQSPGITISEQLCVATLLLATSKPLYVAGVRRRRIGTTGRGIVWRTQIWSAAAENGYLGTRQLAKNEEHTEEGDCALPKMRASFAYPQRAMGGWLWYKPRPSLKVNG
jgi:hypothetical protein